EKRKVAIGGGLTAAAADAPGKGALGAGGRGRAPRPGAGGRGRASRAGVRARGGGGAAAPPGARHARHRRRGGGPADDPDRGLGGHFREALVGGGFSQGKEWPRWST